VSLSLVVVTRSRPTLARAVESCFAGQTLGPDDEVLVVGAGAQPAARDVAARFGAAYAEVDPGGGEADWKDRARSLPAGSHVFYVDESDMLLGNAVALLRGVLAERGAPVVVRGELRNGIRERAVLARRDLMGSWRSLNGYVQDTVLRAGGRCADLNLVAFYVKPWPDRW
jgi:hypothetical protein